MVTSSGAGAAVMGAITDVAGLQVGHFTDMRRPTGCTVVLTPEGAVAGVDVRGAAPGTRETDLLDPVNLVDRVHAVLLSGGSAWGLDAASGVMRWLEERGIGIQAGPARVPIVPAAVLMDLSLGDHRIRPDAQAGHAACEAASDQPPLQGNVGAGAGATVGKVFGPLRATKGGLGTASVRLGEVVVGALVAVNALGDVIDPATGRIVAGALRADGRGLADIRQSLLAGEPPYTIVAGSNTTIGVIATNVALNKSQATRLAQSGHDGLARTINPVHTMSDGDTMFALATGRSAATPGMLVLATMAAEATARAVLQAVRHAESLRVGDRTLLAANSLPG